MGVSSAISWFFDNEESGIVIEDDCLPTNQFFWFCDELLKKYANSEDVAMVSGCGSSDYRQFDEASYSFTHYPKIWGWASWRRTWQHYDVQLSYLDGTETKDLLGLKGASKETIRFWDHLRNQLHHLNTWDYQFALLCLYKGWLCGISNSSLIQNIGFDGSSTHAHAVPVTSEFESLVQPFNHPTIAPNRALQKHIEKTEFHKKSLLRRAVSRVKRLLANEM